jgi:hypothetical protein
MWRGGHALPRQGQEGPRDTHWNRRWVRNPDCSRSLVYTPDPSTLTREPGGGAARSLRFALGRGDVQLPLAGNSLQFVGATVLEGDT